jgi:thioredoxin-dependent peroxiredoxin
LLYSRTKNISMQEGDDAPNFELNANDGGMVRIDSFKDKKNVVLCFYPKNHLFACPSKKVFKMAKSVISAYEEILSTNSVLFAISVDTIEDQKKFVDEYNIPYRHLSDVNKITCKKYAGLNLVGLAKRSTFVIDKKGIIRKIFRDIDIENHGKEISEFLKLLD